MADPTISATSQLVDILSLQSQMEDLRNVEECVQLGPEEEKFLNSLAHELKSKINCVLSECSANVNALPNNDLNEILLQLKKELGEVEAESESVECEIEDLQKRYVEDYNKMESQLEKLCCSLEFIESQTSEKENGDVEMETLHLPDDSKEYDSKFKLLELSHQIETNKRTLKSLQDLDGIFRRFEAVEKIEDALTGIRVIEVEVNSIRLSLKTYLPFLESVLRQQGIESAIDPLEMNHELIIETVEGTMELNNVEIFPKDVNIGEIVTAALSIRQPTLSATETRSSLEWFVRMVQERISLSALRRFLVRNADKSRYSFEYLNRDDMIVAHLVGGIKALIKLPQGWPLSNLPLELSSLESTSQNSKEISESFLCKILGMANSLNTNLRQNISRFIDNVEELLQQEMH